MIISDNRGQNGGGVGDRNIQEKQEKQTACFGVCVKIYRYLGKIPRWDF